MSNSGQQGPLPWSVPQRQKLLEVPSQHMILEQQRQKEENSEGVMKVIKRSSLEMTCITSAHSSLAKTHLGLHPP